MAIEITVPRLGWNMEEGIFQGWLKKDGEQVLANTEDYPVRFLLISGKPLHEPVAWYGPIVMNTVEELQTAFDEYQKGTFIKIGKERP